jgi:hypothetical protein
MKKVIKPVEKEEAVYITDFRGISCGEYGSPVEVNISFNYGSKYDGDTISLNLTDEEVFPLLDTIRQSISEEYKIHLRQKLKKLESSYEDSIGFRDWLSCESALNSLNLLEFLLNYTKKD